MKCESCGSELLNLAYYHCHACLHVQPYAGKVKEAKPMTRAERELERIREYPHYSLCFGGSEGGDAWIRWVGIPPNHTLAIMRDEHDVREIHPDVARSLAEWILKGLEEVTP